MDPSRRGKNDWSLVAKKMQGTNRSGGGREEPAMWPRVWVATRRERGKKDENNKWDGKKKDIYMKSTTIANSVKYENRAEILLW